MPRRKVQFAQGEYYHFYNRGAGRLPIFYDQENYWFVLRKVKHYVKTLGIAIIAYCLMPNHYHFLVRQDGTQPAGLLMQKVFNSYSKAFNKRYERTGTLFEGRYKVDHITEEEHLLHLCRYIHANPVKDRFVTDLKEWPYSNYLEWINLREGTLVERTFINEYFSTGPSYEEFVSDYLVLLRNEN